ncbi:MAG: Zn-dependent exopeptidase M28 [Planctomycetes bacterium]|nr:Zn-dependent exopeptidase M28 [Planctomycetota bacterium]
MIDAFFMLAMAALPQAAPAAPHPSAPDVGDIGELIAAFDTAPLDDALRERRLHELLQQEGGDEVVVASLPLDADVVSRHRAAAEARLRARLADRPAAESDAAVAALAADFARLGGNVEAVLPGRTRRSIVIGAHYDTAPGSLGIVDNWAACLVLTRLARVLLDVDREHTFRLVGFAGHELGGAGAESYARMRLAAADEPVDACLVLDCVGVSTPMLWWSGSSAGMGEFVADVARRAKLPLRVVDFPGGGSDSCMLRDAGLPVASLIGLAPHRASLLHGPGDRKDAIDRPQLRAITVLALEVALRFDACVEPLHAASVVEKLRIGAPGGRKPLVPEPVEWGGPPPAPAPAKAPASGEPPPAPVPSKNHPADGSLP